MDSRICLCLHNGNGKFLHLQASKERLYRLKLLEEYDTMDVTKSEKIKTGLQKTFVVNYLNHKQIKNIRRLDVYQINNNHDVIVD